MEKLKDQYIGVLILGFVIILMGVILVSQVADQTVLTTQKGTQTENLNLVVARIAGGALDPAVKFNLSTGAPNVEHPNVNWRFNDAYTDCIPTTVTVKNQSGSTMTVTTDYAYTKATGTLTLVNNPNMNFSEGAGANTSTVTYGYCQNQYMATSWNRTILNLVPGFFALGVFVFAAFLIFKTWGSDLTNMN